MSRAVSMQMFHLAEKLLKQPKPQRNFILMSHIGRKKNFGKQSNWVQNGRSAINVITTRRQTGWACASNFPRCLAAWREDSRLEEKLESWVNCTSENFLLLVCGVIRGTYLKCKNKSKKHLNKNKVNKQSNKNNNKNNSARQILLANDEHNNWHRWWGKKQKNNELY